ncbi:cytochrome P450 [Coprinopsis marcescibilis]|uniref:Cytochrome P450 n=1 Tax=Coprinopsis marcescibilis TaxID=230819 RepID=A0A5C3KXQ0_COPMA|nr:cytochrome P450 [Coprinopsis marcescibilis]
MAFKLNHLDLVLTAITLVVSFASFQWSRRSREKLPLPPGPRKIPILGNLPAMPTKNEWIQYHKWCKEYKTDILHLDAAGTSIVVVATSELATELLERRSSIYSGRARMPMIKELMGWDYVFGLMDYGSYWRKHRRLMHHSFHPSAARNYEPHIMKATHNLLNRFLKYPHSPVENLRHLVAESILSIAYGINVQEENDPFVKLAEDAVAPLLAAAIPGTFAVDFFPWLKYVPEWVPGASFKRKAREWKHLSLGLLDKPYQATKDAMASGTASMSFVFESLEKLEAGTSDDAYQEDYIKRTAGTMYTAGTDTTSSAIANCILALLQHPEVLAKAQKELDSVVKPGRLPDYDDQDAMPYVTAMVKEILRYRVIVPMAIPHVLSVEDEFEGYRLPVNSIVVPNAWAMLHDENVYEDPFKFNPERFIGSDGKLDYSKARDPFHACWGFGRRVCPGRFMAFSAVWIAVASIIFVFDIEKFKDEKTGEVIEPLDEQDNALVLMPKPFRCSLKPRSKEKEELVRRVVLLERT